jgi:hypothetical protein
MDATPRDVWDVLMDFPSYPRWNPMVVAISGEQRVGAKLDVRISLSNRRPMTFRPEVVECERERRFAWLGTIGVPGVFDGLHRFEVEPTESGAVFIHSEEFRGVLPPFLGRVVRETRESITAMDEALAQEVGRRRVLRASEPVAVGR